MAGVSDKLFTMLFADDTNTFLTGKNVDVLIETMNEELKKLVDWMYSNKLSLNIAKTHFLIFRSKGMVKPVFSGSIVINNQNLIQENKTKFLGVIIDDTLAWGPHIQYIKGKISKGIGIICKAKNVLNQSTLVNLYYCFVYPYINYAIEIWGDTYDVHINSIHKLLKKTVRIISKSKARDHTKPIFKKLELLDVNKIHMFKVSLTMFKVFHKCVPSIFAGLFTYNHSVHAHQTRQSTKLHVPISRTRYMQRAISVKGVKIWNALSNHIDYNCSILCYKYRLKKYLIDVEDISLIS